MGILLKMGVLAGLGGIAYNMFRKQRPALAGAMSGDAEPVYSSGIVREAGPGSQQFVDQNAWDKVDEQVDESFPASDPPANY